jgi:hypothetical protein
MWRLDNNIDEDWYKKVTGMAGTIHIEVLCDPDLMVEVILYIYKYGRWQLQDSDTSTSRGDDCEISLYRGYSVSYYIKVKLTGSYGTMGYPGDWYDIHVDFIS